MADELLELTKTLVSIKTPSGDIRRLNHCCDFILDYFHQLVRVKRFQYNRIPCLFVSNYVRPKIILNGNIDVVGAEEEMFAPKVKKGKLYGRGAYDAKAQTAAFMKVMAENPNANIGLMVVSDGETGGKWGTSKLVKQFPSQFAIVGEPTDLDIVNETKGAMWIDVEYKGKSAHASMPWAGKNAITEGMHKLEKMFKTFNKKTQFGSTYNISNISSKI